jgi:hypothetical protein
VSARVDEGRRGAAGARRTVLLVLLLGGLADCSYRQHLGDLGDAGAGDAGASDAGAGDAGDGGGGPGGPVVLSDEGGWWLLAVDETHVYTAKDGQETVVKRVPIGGGAVSTVASVPGAGMLQALALDATSAYLATGSGAAQGAVLKVSKEDGAVSTLALGRSFPQDIVVDETHVYWTEFRADIVRRVPVGGGDPVDFAAGQPSPRHMALDATHVYWAANQYDVNMTLLDTWLVKAPKDGSTPTIVMPMESGPYAIAVDATHVYWPSYTAIMKAPKNGGDVTLLAYATGQYPGSIAVDAANVYWAAEGSAMTVPIDGGRRTILVSSTDPMPLAGQIAVRAGSVYFADGSRLWRVDL